MEDTRDGRELLDPRKIPGFTSECRRDITGAWYSPEGWCFRPVRKQVGTDEWTPSVQLAWGCDWLEDDGTSCILNSGLHFGLPEAPIVAGIPVPLPPPTGIGLAGIAGPGTYDWEPTELEEKALARMWARVLRRLCSARDYELCFVPRLVGDHPEEFIPSTPNGIEATLDHFVSELRCRHVARFGPGDFFASDPQLLPWGYVAPSDERFVEALSHGAGIGATGFIIERGRGDQVNNWAKLVSPVVRLDTQLNECLLMFEVSWHGDGLAILSRHADPDDIENACEADDVTAIVRRLRPTPFEPKESRSLGGEPPPWMTGDGQTASDGDD